MLKSKIFSQLNINQILIFITKISLNLIKYNVYFNLINLNILLNKFLILFFRFIIT